TASDWSLGASATTDTSTLSLHVALPICIKTVYAFYKDVAGNVSAAAAASITLDQSAPVNGSATATAGNGQVVVNWSGFIDAASGLPTTNTHHLFSSTACSPAFCTGTPLL